MVADSDEGRGRCSEFGGGRYGGGMCGYSDGVGRAGVEWQLRGGSDSAGRVGSEV